MKKILTMISVLALLFLSACGSAQTEPEASAAGTDYTVKLDTYNPADYGLDPANNENDPRVTVYNTGQTQTESRIKTLNDTEECFDECEVAVYGKVLTTANWDEDGDAHTIYHFQIEKSYKGEYKPGDIITIRTYGGYYRKSRFLDAFNGAGWNKLPEDSPYRKMTREELDNVFTYMSYGNPMPKVGEELMVFLWEDPPYDKLYIDCNFSGRFHRNAEGQFERWVPPYEPEFFYVGLKEGQNPNEKFTFEEFDAKLEGLKKAEQDKEKE